MESGDVIISDVHDFSSMYGEFLSTGNDPSLGQLGSIRFAANGLHGAGGKNASETGGDFGGGATQSAFTAGTATQRVEGESNFRKAGQPA